MSLLLLRRCPWRVRAFCAASPSTTSSRHAAHYHVSCPAAASQGGESGGLAPPDVRELAKLASIAVTDEEVAKWQPKIQSTVAWFDQLQAADLQGVEPATHPFQQDLPLRPDVPQDYASRQEVLKQAPDREETYIKVPRITIGDGDSAAPATAAAAAPPADEPTAAAAPSTPDLADDVTLSEADVALLSALDIRAGVITACSAHPDADSLYVETIDVGDAEPRTIVSGLKKYVPLEEMQDRPVLVLCNLKPRNMRGVKSFGMLLAASNPEHTVVEPLAPPPGTAPGDRIFFGGHREQAKPLEPNQVGKKKVWEEVQPGLGVDGGRVANFRGAAMRSAAGVVTAKTIADGRIS